MCRDHKRSVLVGCIGRLIGCNSIILWLVSVEPGQRTSLSPMVKSYLHDSPDSFYILRLGIQSTSRADPMLPELEISPRASLMAAYLIGSLSAFSNQIMSYIEYKRVAVWGIAVDAYSIGDSTEICISGL